MPFFEDWWGPRWSRASMRLVDRGSRLLLSAEEMGSRMWQLSHIRMEVAATAHPFNNFTPGRRVEERSGVARSTCSSRRSGA
jgi:hypothetical protein